MMLRKTLIPAKYYARIAVLALLFLALFYVSKSKSRPHNIPQAKSYFSKLTGIPVTKDCSFIGYKNDFDLLEGEVGVAIEIPTNEINALIMSPPPIGEGWFHGPVEKSIAVNCSFIYTNMYNAHGQPQEAKDILESADILYCVSIPKKARLPKSGALILVQASTRTVWLSVWHY